MQCQDSQEEYIHTILVDAEDASQKQDQWIDAKQQKIKYIKAIQENENKILHEKDVERSAEQQRAEEEQSESNTRSLKHIKNIMGI